MVGRRRSEAVDPARLAERLKILAAENRIELLRQLQVPLTLSEIQLTPSRASRSLDEGRHLAKQTVAHHLDVLLESGFVRARRGVRGGKELHEYHVNHAELFLLVEELKSLSLIRTARGRLDERTEADRTPPESGNDLLRVSLPRGPALVLMTGPLIGTPYALDGAGAWTIGRGEGCHVPVRFDPFVSAENARVERDVEGFHLRSLPRARNGTTLNWSELAENEGRRLAAGDVVGVGRSLLLVRGV